METLRANLTVSKHEQLVLQAQLDEKTIMLHERTNMLVPGEGSTRDAAFGGGAELQGSLHTRSRR